MSELTEKLEHTPPTTGAARAQLDYLRTRGGFRAVSGPEDNPSAVEICPGDRVTSWRRVTPGVRGVFEVQPTTKEQP